MIELTKCVIEGHYYKIDLGDNRQIDLSADFIGKPFTYFVKCQRCGKRILINDKGGGL